MASSDPPGGRKGPASLPPGGGPSGRPAFAPLPPAEARLRMLFENSPSGIALHELVVDADGRPIDYVFLEVNAAFEEQTGLAREVILGRRVTEVLPGIESDPADWIGTYGRVAMTGEPIRFEQRSATLRRWYDVTAYSPARGFFGVIFTDVTEHRRLADALREEGQLRERFMAILGHDLRLPMTVVRTSVETLLRGGVADPRPALERCVRATRTMESLVATLLDTSRLRAGQGIPVAPAPADAGEICRRAVDDALAFAPDQRILLVTEGDLSGSWDPDRVAQALGNVIVNALAYGDPGAPVRVSARRSGDAVEIAVANAGAPIAKEALATLFEPFSRPPREGAVRGGLGLGLYIVREVARAHGGSVEVSSGSAGTAFTLRLPRSAPRRGG